MVDPQRVNLVTNPSFEVNLSGWAPPYAGNNATSTRDTTQMWSGSASVRLDTPITAERMSLSPWTADTGSTTYTASAYVRGTGTATIRLASQPNWTYFGASVHVTLTSAWQRISVTGTSPVGATSVSLIIGQETTGSQSMWIDGVLLEQASTVGSYFDGSLGPGYVWGGTANASVSYSMSLAVSPVTGGIQIQVTPYRPPGTDHCEVYRSVSDTFWLYSYFNTVTVAGVVYARILRQANGGIADIDTTDQSVETGVAYTYFVRVFGSDLVSYTDSATATATCTLQDSWIVPVSLAIGVATPVNCEFRWPAHGLQEAPDVESTDLLFAGRTWPVVDYGIHESSEFAVVLDLPYGEYAAGFGDEAVLRGYVTNRTMLVYRDKRGRKAYGRIQGLKFTDSQYGKSASFTFQTLDIDGSV